jgi:hypothetical protein
MEGTMTRRISDRLPPEILEAFSGEIPEAKIGLAYLLVSIDPDGRPRPCMLSAGEILAVDETKLRVALWPGTHTAENLARGVPTVICFVSPGIVLYVKGAASAMDPVEGAELARFEIAVSSVEADIHPGMPVTQTITFGVESMDAATVAESWRRQIEFLRA